MYRIAFETFVDNYAVFVGAALALAAVEAVGLEAGFGVTLVVGGMLALYSHRMILLDESYGWAGGSKLAPGERMPMWAFLWRYALFSIAFFIALFIVFLPMLPRGQITDGQAVASIFMALVLVAPVMAALLALFGTALPATAVGGDRSWARAVERGRLRFKATFVRLAVGPGLFTVVNLILVVLLAQFVDSVITAFLVNFAAYYLSFFPLHLTAAALSLAYREAETMGV